MDGGKRTIIKATGVNQSFTVGDETFDVLKSVSFEIKENTFNIIYGPSGSGKSTILNILTGLLRPSSGEILFDQNDIYNFTPDRLAHFRANEIGIVYQQNFWVKSLSVIENVSMPLYFLGYSRTKANEAAYRALEQVNMQSYAKKYPILLSGGEQQRVAMARAIVNRPMFIIADEPTGSLDSKSGDMIMELLRSTQSDSKRTIILVTHNMEYLPLADHLLHIEDGLVKELVSESISETTDKLLQDMKARIDRFSKTGGPAPATPTIQPLATVQPPTTPLLGGNNGKI
jgi:putative ABC transport system ATP-binding protein